MNFLSSSGNFDSQEGMTEIEREIRGTSWTFLFTYTFSPRGTLKSLLIREGGGPER